MTVTPTVDKHETDVLIIGGGGAGLRAAIEAAPAGRVTILSKGPYARGGATVMAGADIMLDGRGLSRLGLPGNPQDSPESFFRDILIEGFELNNQSMVQAYVEDAPARVGELLEWGLKYDPERVYSRAIIAAGAEILRVLRRKAQGIGLEVFEYFMALDLITHDGRVHGVLALDVSRGRLVLFSAKVVILATGGWHELFAFNTGSDELCGDGPAMALRAGARLTNMEMIAFCPNIILHPPAFRGSVLLYNFLTGKLLNAAGDEFLLWEDPEILGIAQTSEWNKLVYSRASWREIQAGRGSPNGGVYYSLRHVPEAIWEALAAKSRWRKGWKFQGKDFTPLIEKLRRGDAVEVAPGAHYFEGGVKVDAETRTDLSGLLAAGECSGELFGANRVSAATTEMLVQGARAGRRAVELLDGAEKGRPEPVVDEESLRDYIAPLGRPAGLRPAELKTEIQKEAYRCLGPIRRKMDLAGFLERIPQWRRSWTELSAPARLGHNRAWVDALEVRNLLDLAEATARSALARRESRGGHHRDDYPLLDNHGWLRSVLSRMSGPDFKIETEQTMITTHEPQGAVMTCNEAIRRALRLEGGGEDA